MASHISKLRKSSKNQTPTCAYCDRKAVHAHHIVPQSEGGSDDLDNLVPVCFYHHHEAHALPGDWVRWGRKGGDVTSRDPYNWVRNLRQFKTWSQERIDQYIAGKYGIDLILVQAFRIAAATN